MMASSNGYNTVWMGGGMVMMNSYYYGGNRPTSMPNPRVVPLTLRTEDRSSTKLVAFEGTVIAEATVPNVEVLKHENLEAVVKAPFDAGVGQRLTVTDYTPQKDGTTKVRLRIESIPVVNRRRGGLVMNPFAGVAFAVNLNQSDGGNLIANYTFLDRNGKPVTKPKAGPLQMVEANFGYAQEVELTFVKDNKPTQLTVLGTKSVLLEVPFKMANVPLP